MMKCVRMTASQWFLSMCVVLLCCGSWSPSRALGNVAEQEGLPGSGLKDVHDFVYYLRSAAPKAHPNLDLASSRLDAKKVSAFISSKGVTFVRTETPTSQFHATRSRVEKEVQARRGATFKSFGHVAYTCARLNLSDEVISPVKTGASWRVTLGNDYVLDFVEEAQHLRLSRVDYISPDGE